MPTNLSYPEVYVPSEVTSITSSLPPLPDEPKEPQRPLSPVEPEKNNQDLGCGIVLIIAGVACIIYMISESDANINFIALAILAQLFGLILISMS